jgi:hypothetical protein
MKHFNELINELYKLKLITDKPPVKLSGFRLTLIGQTNNALLNLVGNLKPLNYDFTLPEVVSIINDIESYRKTNKLGASIKKFTKNISELRKYNSIVQQYSTFTAEIKYMNFDSSIVPSGIKLTKNIPELYQLISEIEFCNSL